MKKALGMMILLTATLGLTAGTRIVVRSHVRTPVVVHKTVTVRPATGTIDINCNRDDARVFVNGAFAGKAGSLDGFPGKLTLKPGTYTIRVQKGRKQFKQRVVVQAGRELNLKVKL